MLYNLEMRFLDWRRGLRLPSISVLAAIAAFCGAPSLARAAIGWDAGSNTQWWFDEVNWSSEANNRLPPSNADPAPAATDTQINIGTGAWDLGEGVVYDPTNDPNFSSAGTLAFPAGFGPQSIAQLYISRATPNTNLLTIKGDLQLSGNMIIGRSSGTRNLATNGRINQKSGKVVAPTTLDLGQTDTGANPPANGFGNGIYDYQGGILEVGIPLAAGLRMSGGTGSNAQDGMPAGTGGVGRFIMHNPASGGYVHVSNLVLAAFPGVNDSIVDDKDPNGTTKGVGILEFHYENGQTRPFQLDGNLSLNNGLDPVTGGTRSARLDLRLNEPVTLTAGIPENLGLVDVDFPMLPEDFVVGIVGGTGSLGGTFNSADGLTNYPEGAEVRAQFGSTIYKWNISYRGKIEWADPLNSVTASVVAGDPSLDKDVVLIGLGSEIVVVNDADFDNDLDVDGADFLTWQRGFGGTTTGDADGNGMVDGNDYLLWRRQFAEPLPIAAAVPEPATIALVAVVCIAAPLVHRVSRRRPGAA